MNEKSYTARELAEMKLTGLPSTKSAIIRRAHREGWDFVDRTGIGGGRHYLFSNFTAEIRREILERTVSNNQSVVTAVPKMDRPRSVRLSSETREDAKWYICRQFDTYTARHSLLKKQAEPLFVNLYKSEKASRDYQWFADWIFDAVPQMSLQSLRRWRSKCQATDGLKAKYGNRKGNSILARAENGSVQEHIVGLIYHKPHIRAGAVRDFIRSKFGETLKIHDESGEEKTVELPHVRTFEKFMIQWKDENASVFLKISDPDGWRNQHMVAIGNASADVHRLNQRWEIDASPADMICVDGRYAIYAMIDLWSRRIMFSVSKNPSTEASLLLVRRAIMEWGVPEVIKTDQGSDFTSSQFTKALRHIGIVHDDCQAYSPDRKPHVERVIKTMQHDLMELLSGYVGHSVTDRKKIEARKSFSQRLGASDQEVFEVNIDHIKLQECMDKWAFDKYAHKKHSTIGMTPFARVASWDQPIRRIENIRALDLLLAPLAGTDGWRNVGKKGLRIDNGHFYGPNLELHIGNRVFVRHDPEDMGRVYVFNEDHEFICEALNYERLGVDPTQAAAEAKARQKLAIAEGTKEIRRQARQITPEKIAEDILSTYAHNSNTLTQFPQRAEIHTSGSLDEAQRAVTGNDFTIHEFKKQVNPIKIVQSDQDGWWDKAMHLEALQKFGAILDGESAVWLERAQKSGWYQARLHREELIADLDQ